jgi:YbbR domain-containing protein
VLQRMLDALTNDLILKLTALGLAFLLWTLVKTDNQVGIDGIPIQVVNRDESWTMVGQPDPPTVRVVFSGPVRELFRMTATDPPSLLVPVEEVTDSSEFIPLRLNWVALGAGMNNTRVEEIRPSAVRIKFDRVRNREVPVTISVLGSPLEGFELSGPVRVEPSRVRVSGASRLLAEIDTLRLRPLDLTEYSTTDTIVVPIDSAGNALIFVPNEVRVIVPIQPVKRDTAGTGPVGGTG